MKIHGNHTKAIKSNAKFSHLWSRLLDEKKRLISRVYHICSTIIQVSCVIPQKQAAERREICYFRIIFHRTDSTFYIWTPQSIAREVQQSVKRTLAFISLSTCPLFDEDDKKRSYVEPKRKQFFNKHFMALKKNFSMNEKCFCNRKNWFSLTREHKNYFKNLWREMLIDFRAFITPFCYAN